VKYLLAFCLLFFGLGLADSGAAKPSSKYTKQMLRLFEEKCIKPVSHADMLRAAPNRFWSELNLTDSRWEGEYENLKAKSSENSLRIFSDGRFHLILRKTILSELENTQTSGNPIIIDCELFDVGSKNQLNNSTLNKFFESLRATTTGLPKWSQSKAQETYGSSVLAWLLPAENNGKAVFAEHLTQHFINKDSIKLGLYPRTGLRLGFYE
jgi:hypothetical protein